MGQKANPIGLRLGVIKGWDSNWFGGRDYADKLVEDTQIRNYLKVRLPKGSISKIVIERTLKLITVTINTARPGIIIGKGGSMLTRIGQEARLDIEKFIERKVFLELHVKVRKDWRNNDLFLKEYGY